VRPNENPMNSCARMLVLGLLLGCAASAATISLVPSASNVGVGGNLTVDVIASGLTPGTAIGAFDFAVTYPTALLSPVSVSFFDRLGAVGDQITSSDLSVAGLVSATELSFEDPAALLALQSGGSVPLFRLDFQAQQVGRAQLGFANSPSVLSDELGNALQVQRGSAAIDIFDPGTTIDSINLVQWMLNLDGDWFDSEGDIGPKTLPSHVNTSGFDFEKGLGTIAIPFTKQGTNKVTAFFDHEIRQTQNGFTNERGSTGGARPNNVSWEIGEPGYVTPPPNIYTNAIEGKLANANGVGPGMSDDVAMALAWNFILGYGGRADLQLSLSTTQPTSGFYLRQTDPDQEGDISLYFSGALTVDNPNSAVPEPSSLLLFVGAAVLLAGRKLRRISAAK